MPAPLLTPRLLRSIRTTPRLPPSTWPFLTGVTLCVLNRPDELGTALAHALATGPRAEEVDGGAMVGHERLEIARKMREGVLKGAIIGGLPKVRRVLFAGGRSGAASDGLAHSAGRNDQAREQKAWELNVMAHD